MASGRSVPFTGTFTVVPLRVTVSEPVSENGRTVRLMVTSTGLLGLLECGVVFTVTPGALVVNLPSLSSAGAGRGGFMVARPAPVVRFVVGISGAPGDGCERTTRDVDVLRNAF